MLNSVELPAVLLSRPDQVMTRLFLCYGTPCCESWKLAVCCDYV